jgi:hypothetical protein
VLKDKIGAEIIGINSTEVSGREAIVVLDRVLQTSHTVDLLLRMDNGAIETVTLLPLPLIKRFISIFQRLPKEMIPPGSTQSLDSVPSFYLTHGLQFRDGKYHSTR